MSEFKEIKRDFLRDMAISGHKAWPLVGKYTELADSVVPRRLLERWVDRFYRVQVPAFNPKPRLVNHFKLGADPEFVFISDGRIVNAMDLGLKAGLAIGADNNGRLAELRPAASKSALEVVASLYAELCFLAQWAPAMTKYRWVAQPFIGRDGLGGHIHFGRWHRPRTAEVLALDTVMHLLEKANCISLAHQKQRLATNLYGKYGDVRAQAHGYEYRTFPTWLAEPRHAHLYLTLSKLAVHAPDLFTGMRIDSNTSRAQGHIDSVLAYWQNLDDDAKLARVYLKACFLPPTGDIQESWGILPVFTKPGDMDRDVLPPAVKPFPQHVETMFKYLSTGFRQKMPEITFEPLRFPAGCQPFQKVLLTERRPELGEALWDLAMLPIGQNLLQVAGHNQEQRLLLSRKLYDMVLPKLRRPVFIIEGMVGQIAINGNLPDISMSIPTWMLARNMQKATKKFLTESGAFPFVRLGQELPAADNWKAREREKTLLLA